MPDLGVEVAQVAPTAGAKKRTNALSALRQGVAEKLSLQGVSRIKLIGENQAVESQISLNGRQLETLLCEGSFNRSREGQIAYAKSLGYRMATREENLAYVEGLLAKEANGTIDNAERIALATYRVREVRDTEGGLDVVDDRRVRASRSSLLADGLLRRGALFVRASRRHKGEAEHTA